MAQTKTEPCEFNDKGICYAMCCYSSQNCEARDEDGNPQYADTDECIKRLPKNLWRRK